MTNRRAAITLWISALATPLATWAQPQQNTMPRVGFLISETLALQATRIEALRAGLRERGYVEGKNIAVEVRSAEGHYDGYPDWLQSSLDSRSTYLWRSGSKRSPPHAEPRRRFPS